MEGAEMIKSKKIYRWQLITDLLHSKSDNTPEENIAEASKYLAFIYNKPVKNSKKIININDKMNEAVDRNIDAYKRLVDK
jgi:hypothetical protein